MHASNSSLALVIAVSTAIFISLFVPATARAASKKLAGTIVVVNQKSDSITLVDVATREAYRHVKVVAAPHEAAVSPDGRTVVVTNYARPGEPQRWLSVVALPSGETLRTIDLAPWRKPHDVRWVDAERVVCTAEADSALLVVHVGSGKVERVIHTGNALSHMLALSTDRRRIYCSNMTAGSVSAFDFATGEKLADIPTGKECEGVGVSPDGRWVVAGNRAEDTISILDAESLKVVARVASPGFPYRVQFTPDGRHALVPHAQSGALVMLDVAKRTVSRVIALRGTHVPDPSTAGVFPHPDGRHAFVTVRNDDSVLVLDLATGETLARVAAQSSPDGVAWSPIGR
ncbi:MAG: cytochrome D1 domain-containing protein [Candidatus Eisenbacteria bacterium]